MFKQGNKVHLRAPKGTRAGGQTSDLLVNDAMTYDVYTPTTSNPSRIIGAIAKKNSQTQGVVLDLTETPVTPLQLGNNPLKRVQNAGATNITDLIIIGK